MVEFLLDFAGSSVFDGSPQACRDSMRHVGLQWVTDQACSSLTNHVEVFDGSPTKHVGL